MDVLLAGPGRAGLALALCARSAGHRVAGVLARDAEAGERGAALLDAAAVPWHGPLPEADLLVIAVRDDAIPAVAAHLAPHAGSVGGVVHLSGLTSVAALDAITEAPIGSFHPLQTLPNPEAGAERLPGAWVAVTSADNLFADRLFAFAAGLGMRPFALENDDKALYHAAAAAAANYPIAALAMAERLFAAAGVPFDAARPLVEAVVGNAFDLGPTAALTGPVARGDAGTVTAQRHAVAGAVPDLGEDFDALVAATARVAGRDPGEVLR
jgi:predicted short-subunit dehydrogenase-like oxidoreductase (DUF2520 family)